MVILSVIPDPPDALPMLVFLALLVFFFSLSFIQRSRGLR